MYSLLVRIGAFFLHGVGVFDEHINNWNKTRKAHLSRLLPLDPNQPDTSYIWIHCASVGEYQQILPFIDLFTERLPQFKIFLTFFSPSGFQQVQNPDISHIMYLPLDTKDNMQKIIKSLRPKVFIGVKYEWWWNLFELLNQYQIPKILVAVKFDRSHYIFRWYSARFRKILAHNTTMLCQDEATKTLACSLHIPSVKVCGDPRVDTVIQRKALLKPLPEKLNKLLSHNKPIIIYASIYVEDLSLIKHTISKHPNFFHLIVPHKSDTSIVRKISKFLAIPHCYTQTTYDQKPENALIIDTTGILFDLYQLARFCYVGGGFTHNVHNTLEPAVHYLPICIGPKYRNFAEIDYFIKNQLIHVAKSPDSFSNFISQIHSDDIHKIKTGLITYFEQNSGAGEKIFLEVENVLNRKS